MHMVMAVSAAGTLSYVLPIRLNSAAGDELIDYVRWLSSQVELIIVDGSTPSVFQTNATLWPPRLVHIPPDDDVRAAANGKVAGVITGVRHASRDRIVIADEDVRYDERALGAIGEMLCNADVVRPQNYFDPVPWHACFDTARTLLNRVSGGDWPGTLGVRRSMLLATSGYDGDVLFENLELVRTVIAAGGVEARPLDLYVRRRPPSTEHFWSQRVRQAYDEFARPLRLVIWLAVLPAAVAAIVTSRWDALGAAAAGVVVTAEAGRRRAGGARMFPVIASLAAPLWVVERAVGAWMALAARFLLGGVPYRGRIVRRAATPFRVLRARHAHAGDRMRTMTPDAYN
jgi:hypothetical protein